MSRKKFFYVNKFAYISDEKLIADIFDSSQIKSLMKDSEFEKTMDEIQNEAWIYFKLLNNN